MYKIVEIRGRRCQRGLWDSRFVRCLSCSVLGTMWCSPTTIYIWEISSHCDEKFS